MTRIFVLLAACLSSACFRYRSASTGPTGCAADEIQVRDVDMHFDGNRTWTAICRDKQYQCWTQVTGTPECDEVPIYDGGGASAHRLERSYDAQRKAQVVRAHVRIDARRWLELSAAPAIDERVSASMSLLEHRGVVCDAATLTLNGTALPSAPTTVRDQGPTYRLDTTFGPELLRELRRPHPTLSLEGCGQTVALDDAAMATLSELTRMVDDLASMTSGNEAATSSEPASAPAPAAERVDESRTQP